MVPFSYLQNTECNRLRDSEVNDIVSRMIWIIYIEESIIITNACILLFFFIKTFHDLRLIMVRMVDQNRHEDILRSLSSKTTDLHRILCSFMTQKFFFLNILSIKTEKNTTFRCRIFRMWMSHAYRLATVFSIFLLKNTCTWTIERRFNYIY